MDESATAGAPLGARALLRLRDFRLLWLAQLISDFGDSLTNLALLIFVNHLTGSTTALATMAIVLGIPQVTFGLLAGVYVDRLDRKRIMMVSDGLRGLLVLGFVGASLGGQLWLMYLLGFLQASIGAFFTPARGAVLPLVVPRAGLLAANSLTQTSRIIAGLAGTATSGLLFGLFETVWPAFVLDALTFFCSVALVSRVIVPKMAAAAGPATPRIILGQLSEGLRTIAGSRVLTGTLLALAVTMLGLGAVNVLLVPFILNDLRVPATWFGAVEFAQTSSMILSGSLLAVLAARLAPTRLIAGSLLILGALVGLVAAAQSVWYLLAILFAVGWVVTPLQASVTTIAQTAVPNELRGRTGAALSTVISSANLASMALAGVLGDVAGARNVFLIAGIVVVLAGVAATAVFGTAPKVAPSPAQEPAP